MSAAVQLLLFAHLPEAAAPVAEWSQEWRDAQMLRLVEAVRFNPDRLAAASVNHPDMRDFCDYAIRQLGGRSQ